MQLYKEKSLHLRCNRRFRVNNTVLDISYLIVRGSEQIKIFHPDEIGRISQV